MSYLLIFLCGILTALPYVFEFLFILPYFSIAPLFIIALKKKSAYRHGLCFFMGYYLVVYHWFAYLYPLDFAGFNKLSAIPVVAVAWLGMSLMQSIGGAFVPFIFKRITNDNKRVLFPFIAASLWCIMEWAQNFFWFGVPWARLALTQYKILPIIQSASLFGAIGLGFLIVLISGFLAEAYLALRENKKIKLSVIIASSLFLFNFVFGVVRLCLPQKNKETLTVPVIQGNILSSDKWADNSVETSLELYSELSKEASNEKDVKLIVWSETVLITDIKTDEAAKIKLCQLSDELDSYIAVGAFYENNGCLYNSIYLFTPDGSCLDNVYSKRHLVPFGEYLPMEKAIKTILPFLADINMLSKPLTPGKDSEIFDTELGKIGSLICFDSIYESITLDSVRDGAELIILSTNDSWYKDSPAVYQHNAHAVLRAVESGRYVVRSANTGVSSVISGNGKILTQIEALKTGYTVADVSLSSQRTVYSYIGNTVAYLSLLFVFIIFIYPLVKKYLKKHCQKSIVDV